MVKVLVNVIFAPALPLPTVEIVIGAVIITGDKNSRHLKKWKKAEKKDRDGNNN